MIFDSTINVSQITVNMSEDDSELSVGLMVGLTMPVSQTQAMNLPAGQLRFTMGDQEAVLELAEKLREAGEKLPKSSGLEVATNLSDVEKEAKQMERLRNGQKD